MRRMLLAALVALPISAFAGQGNYDVKVEGMTCDSCVKSVNEALNKLPNLEKDSVKVVLKENKATLTLKDDKKENLDAIKKAVEGAGFKVAAVNIAGATKKN